MFKIFVTVDKHQCFKSLSVKPYLSGLNIHPRTLKIHLLIISKLVTISSNCGLWSSASQHSIVQLLLWNGRPDHRWQNMWWDSNFVEQQAKCIRHLRTKIKVLLDWRSLCSLNLFEVPKCLHAILLWFQLW